MRPLVVLVVLASLVPGCTVIGGVSGYTVGRIIHDGEEPRTYNNPRGVTVHDSPVATDTLIGAGVGLLLDIAAIAALSYALRDLGSTCPCHFD